MLAVSLLCLGLLVHAPAAAGAASAQPRIGGGAGAAPDSLPWSAALVRHEREGGPAVSRQFCGGTLVSSRVVLTAAHCVDERSPSGFQVILGRSDLGSPDGETIDASAMLIHPLFDPRTYRNDLALVALAVSSQQAPVSLVGTAERSLWAPWQAATVAGWGSTSEGSAISPVLNVASISILPNRFCTSRAAYGPTFRPPEMLCAGRPDSSADACSGDSGGPLLAGSPSRLVGVVSWGRGCARPGVPGVYTRLGAPALNTWAHAGMAALELGRTSGAAPRTVVRGRSRIRLAAPGEPWVAFQCSQGRSRYSACPRTPRARSGGRVLRVRAVNLYGGVDPTPATVRSRRSR